MVGEIGTIMKLNSLIKRINLASQSPARLEILRNQGLEVGAYPQDLDEHTDKTHPGEVVEDLAMQKLSSFMKSPDFDPSVVSLACDTLISFQGKLIGKAHSDNEAREQIKMFAGNTHEVFSGYALCLNGKIYHGYDCTKVSFREISPSELENYIKSQEWRGAAGSYHIQGLAKGFIYHVAGDINTVIGLPLFKVSEIITHNAQ